MVIKSVKTDGYKNLENVEIELDPNMNVICGENAQGKTNLIEAIWLCSGCRSFRGTRDKDFIGFTKEKASVELNFQNSQREQQIFFEVKKNSLKDKFVTLNGVRLPLLSRVFGNFCCVVFTPEDLNLTKGAPDNRRTFLDLSISQIKPAYLSTLKKYNYVLGHRNSLLKAMSRDERFVEYKYVEVWDEQLAKFGARLTIIRNNYCKMLNKYTKSLHEAFTDGKEQFDLNYKSTVFKDFDLEGREITDKEAEQEYFRRLRETADVDMRTGFTSIGTHRDDLDISINGLSVRDFGSQGQARSAALVLKFSHAHIIRNELGESPVMLLDDVLSELDVSRKRFILNNVGDMQVIITCCDDKFITDMADGKVFKMKNGRVGD